MNKLMASVLTTLGYEVYSHLAGVIWSYPVKRPPGHRMLTVKVEDQFYLVDVGFGGPGQISPLKLVIGEEQRQGSHLYRLEMDDTNEYELQKKKGDTWEKLYAFNQNNTFGESSYESHNVSVATSLASSFVKNMICTMPKFNGRVTMTDNTLKLFENENGLDKLKKL